MAPDVSAKKAQLATDASVGKRMTEPTSTRISIVNSLAMRSKCKTVAKSHSGRTKRSQFCASVRCDIKREMFYVGVTDDGAFAM